MTVVQTADEAVCVCVFVVCITAEGAHDDLLQTQSNNVSGLMEPAGLTHNMHQRRV